MQRGQTVCRILWEASDGMANHSSGFIGQGSRSCFSSGHERACHGQMRSTHDVSPQLLAILLWTRGWCCPVAVNPRATTYRELVGITRNDLSNPSTPPGHAVCLAGIVEMGAKIGDDSPQTNLELDVEPTQRPVLHSILDSKAYRSSLEAQPTPR